MILDSLMDKEVEKLDDHGSLKVQKLFDAQIWFSWVTWSDTRPQFFLRSASQKCLVIG